MPPRIHDLLRLAAIAGIPLRPEIRDLLADFQQYCLEGRYPDAQPPAPLAAEAVAGLQKVQETIAWLKQKLR